MIAILHFTLKPRDIALTAQCRARVGTSLMGAIISPGFFSFFFFN